MATRTTVPPAVRHKVVQALWAYATLDPRLSDDVLRVLLVHLAMSNLLTPPALATVCATLHRSEEEISAAMARLVELGYMVEAVP